MNSKLFIILLIMIIGYSCEKETNLKSSCNTSNEELLFNQIYIGMGYVDVENVLGSQGDKYRTDQSGNSVMEFYRWEFCNDPTIKIETWFNNDEIVLKEKTFKGSNCSNQINNGTFNNISIGDNYNNVKSYFSNEVGDKFRTDYTFYATDTTITDFYRWYDCSDDSKYIEVWFDNSEVRLTTKNF